MEDESLENVLLDEPMYNPDTNTIQIVDTVTLDTIHQDLGFICAFLVLFSVVVLLKAIYKFFNMFF